MTLVPMPATGKIAVFILSILSGKLIIDEKMAKFHWLLALVAFLILSAAFQFSTSNVVDLDSFFYMRLGALYRDAGIFNVDFPWIAPSVIKEFSSSLWYGFGILLIPFTPFPDLSLGIKAAGFIFTAIFLFLFYLVLRGRDIKWAAFWPFLLFFAAPNTTAHFLMTRPQTVSLILAAPLFFFVSRRLPLGILLTSFGIAWVHMNFSWLPLLVTGVFVVWKLILEQKFAWKKILWSLAGVAIAIFSRPNPIGAIKLFYTQVFQQILEKQGGLPLLFGIENVPIGSAALFTHFGAFMFLWLMAIALWVYFLAKRNKADSGGYWQNNDVFVSAAMTLSVVFFILTAVVARRAYDFWVLFGIIGIAVVFTYICLNFRKSSQADIAKIAVGAIFIFMVFYSGYRTLNNLQKSYAADYLKEPAAWLKEHSNPGDVVFNAHWSNFSPLFAWNQKNYYTGGLDPIFQYQYSPSLYWKFHYLSTDQVTKKTCGAIACTVSMLEDTYEVLKRDFSAKYALLQKKENPAVNQYMGADQRFEKVFENNSEVIYLIK